MNTYLHFSLHIKQNKIDGYCLEAKIDRFLYNCFILGKLDHQSARLRFLRDSETIIFLRKLWRNNYKINEKHATSSISYILLRIRSIQLIIPHKIRNWLKCIQLIFGCKESKYFSSYRNWATIFLFYLFDLISKFYATTTKKRYKNMRAT